VKNGKTMKNHAASCFAASACCLTGTLNRHIIPACCLLAVLLCSCDDRRDILEEASSFGYVRVRIDWTQAGIDPNGASVYFFPRDGSQPRGLWTNHTLDSLYLPVGVYSVLMFNERTTEHAGIAFRGTDAYDTFEAYAVPESALPEFMSRGTETPRVSDAVSDPDILAAAHMDRFELTRSMTRNGAGPLLEFSPARVTAGVRVTVRISGLQYLDRSISSGGSLSGMAGGVMLSTGEPTSASVTQYFPFLRTVLDESSDTSGTMLTVFSSFGPAGMSRQALSKDGLAATNMLGLQFHLRNGTTWSPDLREVTGRFERAELDIDLKIGYNRWEGDTIVTLPYVPPADGMFDADVNGWGDSHDTDIPL
jgi:hypothetical protein